MSGGNDETIGKDEKDHAGTFLPTKWTKMTASFETVNCVYQYQIG